MCQHKDDFIIISCERHQPVVEAFTEIYDCHYGCWFLGHLLHKNHSLYQGYLATRSIWCGVHPIFWLLVFLRSFCCCQLVEDMDQLRFVQAWQDCTIRSKKGSWCQNEFVVPSETSRDINQKDFWLMSLLVSL